MFKGTDSIFSYSNSEMVDINMKYWLDWSFLNIGAFENITLHESGGYGGDFSRLIPIKDYFHTDGKVWKTFHPNLVWESGLSTVEQPISISGVYVNGSLTSASIDYNRGRVIFDSPIATSSIVQMEYSYKLVNVYSASETDWLGDLQRGTFRVDRQDYSLNSGEYQYNRTNLPAIVYHISSREYRPYQLGLGQWARFSLQFDVLANDRNWTYKIADTISEQKDKTFFLFNANTVAESGAFPLTANGELGLNPLTYDNLINSDYRWNKMRIIDANQGDSQQLQNKLCYIPVKLKTEIVLTDI